MKFDLKRIEQKLEEINQRNPGERGAQPELVLGCFIGGGVDDDSRCISECPNRHDNPQMYNQKCKHYLKSFEVKEDRFDRG